MTIEQLAEIRRIQKLIELERKKLDCKGVELDKPVVLGKIGVGVGHRE